MKHKRKGPKSTRAGSLWSKPQKRQGSPRKDRQRHSVNRSLNGSENEPNDLGEGLGENRLRDRTDRSRG